MVADSKDGMKWKMGSSKSSIAVYYWAKLIGLAPFTLKNNRFYPATLLGKLYPTTLVVIQLFLMLSTLFEQPKIQSKVNLLPSAEKIPISKIAVFVGNAAPCLISIIFLIIDKKIVNLLNELCTTSGELKSLGVVEDHGKFLKNLFAVIVIANTLVGTIVGCVNYFNSFVPLLTTIGYLIKNLINLNTVLIFTQVLIFVRQCFTVVNEKLCASIKPAHHNESPHHLRGSALSMISGNFVKDNRMESEGLTNVERIENFGSFHLKLCDLVDLTTQLFAGPILLCILQFGSMLVLLSYLIYRGFLQLMQISNEELFKSQVLKILGLILLITSMIVQLFIVAHVSSTICQQGNAARVILFKVWNRFPLPELKNEFGMISLQLLHKPITISAFGFFDLGYACPCKIFGAVVAYLIIMIQFDETRLNRVA